MRISHSHAVTSAQRRSFSPDTELTAINHGAPRSSPHFFEPTHSSAYSSVNYAQPRASAASPTFFEAGAHDNGSSVFDVPVPESPQRVSPLYGSPRDPKRISIVGGAPIPLLLLLPAHQPIHLSFIHRSDPSYSPQLRVGPFNPQQPRTNRRVSRLRLSKMRRQLPRFPLIFFLSA